MRPFRSYALLVGMMGIALVPVAGAALRSAVSDAPGESVSAAVVREQRPDPRRGVHAFYFTRGIYSDHRGSWGRNRAWATDYPKADQQFLTVLRRLTNVDAYASEHAVALDDPELRRYPFLYMLEVGFMDLRPAEVQGLRDYLLAGGFLFMMTSGARGSGRTSRIR